MHGTIGKIISVATVAAAAAIAVPAVAAAAAPETIATLDYFVNSRPGSLDGTHPLSETVQDHELYMVKWAGDVFEDATWDDSFISLREDHHGIAPDNSYAFSQGRWMKRSMQVGERIYNFDNYMQNYTVGTGACSPGATNYFPFSTTLLAHQPAMDLGGTLGKQDVIVLQYDYRAGIGTNVENFYYAKSRGLVKWELLANDKVVQTSTFNEVSAGPPVPPAPRCRDTPAPRTSPELPTSVDSFLTDELYGCVLGSAPDAQGFALWKDKLSTHQIGIRDIYQNFYAARTKNKPLSDVDFVKTAYRCMLLREIGDAEAQDIASRTDRNGLVQAVLGSQEFGVRILPRLQLITPDVATLPFNRSVFLQNMYSCVLNVTEPDGPGVDFWWNHIVHGDITPPGLYTEFFKHQSPAVFDNAAFARKVYGCVLYRPATSTESAGVVRQLNGGTSRAQVVQNMLAGAEFTNGILPTLNALG